MTQLDSQTVERLLKDGDQTWLWVLTAAITVNRDKLLILEDEAGDYVPVFNNKAAGQAFLAKLDPEGQLEYQAQAMHQIDLKALAKSESYRVVILDGQGQILERWAAAGSNGQGGSAASGS
ncbi:MAG: hypothetical protein LBS60_13425 [Deltaproteobacteria bacterium]|jgi:hypothetical protein|nr:hypothetical protein [Deltaproteobacteria bacterium]